MPHRPRAPNQDHQAVSDQVNYGVDLYWLPLGAGGHSVRYNGRLYEALMAAIERRSRCDLYHSALEVRVPDGRYVIEMTPVPGGSGSDHGAVAGGAVGSRLLGRSRLFRCEVRRWLDGEIPDIAEALESPQRLSSDPEVARRLLDLVPLVLHPSGVGTNSAAARCGTRTRSSPGLSSRPASTSTRRECQKEAAHPAGRQASLPPRIQMGRSSRTGAQRRERRRHSMRVKAIASTRSGKAAGRARGARPSQLKEA